MYNAKRIKELSFLENLVKNKNHAVIDIRSPEDYRYGTILEAPNAPLRIFLPIFLKTLKKTKKIILIASEYDTDSLNACVKYAVQNGGVDLNLSYFFFQDSQKN